MKCHRKTSSRLYDIPRLIQREFKTKSQSFVPTISSLFTQICLAITIRGQELNLVECLTYDSSHSKRDGSFHHKVSNSRSRLGAFPIFSQVSDQSHCCHHVAKKKKGLRAVSLTRFDKSIFVYQILSFIEFLKICWNIYFIFSPID